MYYLLLYEKIPNYAEQQKPYAADHRDYVLKRVAQGDLIFGGSMEEPTDGSATIVFKTDSPESIKVFAENDPYTKQGIVCKWSIRKWNVVVGTGLA